MPPLITVSDLSIGFRGRALLDGVSCQIEPGQRIALLGRNGAGKTTFMRILCGQVEPDAGTVTFAPTTRLALLPQDVPQDIAGMVKDVVAEGLEPSAADPETAWRGERQLERILSDMELPAAAQFRRMCCYWTSRRTISMSMRSRGWKIFCCARPRR
jgi:ATP-binding cassette subfamily F protein uup